MTDQNRNDACRNLMEELQPYGRELGFIPHQYQPHPGWFIMAWSRRANTSIWHIDISSTITSLVAKKLAI